MFTTRAAQPTCLAAGQRFFTFFALDIDKRRNWRHFATCTCDVDASPEADLPFPCDVRLSKTSHSEYVERTGFEIAAILAQRAPVDSWYVASLEYEETDSQPVVKCTGVSACVRVGATLKAFKAAQRTPVDLDNDEIDEAFDKLLSMGAAAAAGIEAHGPDGDDSDTIDESLEALLALKADKDSDASGVSDIEEAIQSKRQKRSEVWKKGMVSLSSPFFSKTASGSRASAKWKGKEIGFVTMWTGVGGTPSLSCHCKLHTKCRMPASTKYPTDLVCCQWLLLAINRDGSTKMNVDKHIDIGKRIKEKAESQSFEADDLAALGSQKKRRA